MGRKRFSSEQIIVKLRKAEIIESKGLTLFDPALKFLAIRHVIPKMDCGKSHYSFGYFRKGADQKSIFPLNVDVAGRSLIGYIEDASNGRIGMRVNETLGKGWLYKDSLNPIVELDSSGNVVSRFVYASKVNVPDFMIKGGITYRIISDHLSSPRLVIDVITGLSTQMWMLHHQH